MSIELYYHPYSRAANVVWMLEEIGASYQLKFVDLMKSEHKAPEILRLNPMGKLPILRDGEVVVSESAAIGLYLADRYALGRLSPKLDDPRRGTYLRWSLFAPSVIEPGAAAKAANSEFKPSSVGWGTYDTMMDSMETAIRDKQFLLGDEFSMADVIFGGTIRFMLQFQMIDPRPAFSTYVNRLCERPAYKRAEEKNLAERTIHGLK